VEIKERDQVIDDVEEIYSLLGVAVAQLFYTWTEVNHGKRPSSALSETSTTLGKVKKMVSNLSVKLCDAQSKAVREK